MKIWLQISSGRGPEECCWVVMKLSQIVLAEAEQEKLKASCLSANASKHGLFSTLLAIEGAKINTSSTAAMPTPSNTGASR